MHPLAAGLEYWVDILQTLVIPVEAVTGHLASFDTGYPRKSFLELREIRNVDVHNCQDVNVAAVNRMFSAGIRLAREVKDQARASKLETISELISAVEERIGFESQYLSGRDLFSREPQILTLLARHLGFCEAMDYMGKSMLCRRSRGSSDT